MRHFRVHAQEAESPGLFNVGISWHRPSLVVQETKMAFILMTQRSVIDGIVLVTFPMCNSLPTSSAISSVCCSQLISWKSSMLFSGSEVFERSLISTYAFWRSRKFQRCLNMSVWTWCRGRCLGYFSGQGVDDDLIAFPCMNGEQIYCERMLALPKR